MSKYIKSREDECFSRQKKIMDSLGVINPLIFDIGANIGQSVASYRCMFPGSQVHAFEPNPASYQKLSAVYGTTDGVVLQSLDLHEHSGKYPFYATLSTQAASLLKPSDRIISLNHKYNFKLIHIQCSTFDEYCRQNGISSVHIVKIDVQGNELAVLKGAVESLNNEVVTLFYLEIVFVEAYDSQTEMTDIFRLMGNYGYVLWDIMPFVYTNWGSIEAANAVFLAGTAAQKLEKS